MHTKILKTGHFNTHLMMLISAIVKILMVDSQCCFIQPSQIKWWILAHSHKIIVQCMCCVCACIGKTFSIHKFCFYLATICLLLVSKDNIKWTQTIIKLNFKIRDYLNFSRNSCINFDKIIRCTLTCLSKGKEKEEKNFLTTLHLQQLHHFQWKNAKSS